MKQWQPKNPNNPLHFIRKVGPFTLGVEFYSAEKRGWDTETGWDVRVTEGDSKNNSLGICGPYPSLEEAQVVAEMLVDNRLGSLLSEAVTGQGMPWQSTASQKDKTLPAHVREVGPYRLEVEQYMHHFPQSKALRWRVVSPQVPGYHWPILERHVPEKAQELAEQATQKLIQLTRIELGFQEGMTILLPPGYCKSTNQGIEVRCPFLVSVEECLDSCDLSNKEGYCEGETEALAQHCPLREPDEEMVWELKRKKGTRHA